MKCLVFKRNYFNKFSKYRFIKNIKYKIKNEDINYYYTIKQVKLPKYLQNDLYNVIEIY